MTKAAIEALFAVVPANAEVGPESLKQPPRALWRGAATSGEPEAASDLAPTASPVDTEAGVELEASIWQQLSRRKQKLPLYIIIVRMYELCN